MKLNPETIATASSRHPWRTVVIWLVVLFAAGGSASTLLSSALTTDIDFTNTPEAKQAQALLEDAGLKQDVVTETWVIASDTPGAIDDPAFVERVNGVLADLQALGPGEVSAVPAAFPQPADAAQNPQLAALGPFPSDDGRAVLFTIVMDGDVDDAAENVGDLTAIRESATSDGITAYNLGQASSTEDFKTMSEEDLRFGESIGIVAAIVVLLLVFVAIVGGFLPIIMGVFAISVTLGVMGVIGLLWHFSFFAPNLVSMMGLAVGIDYALFIVSRNREERHRGHDKLEAVRRSGATANRAVFFSGITVVLALAGMLLVPTTIFRSLAGGAIIVVLVSVAASMTLLPALLALLGDRVNWPWMRRGGTILAFFVLAAVGGGVSGILGALGLPPVVGILAAALAIAGTAYLISRFVRGSSAERTRFTQRETGGQAIDTKGATLSTDGGFWDRVTRRVMGRPVAFLVSASIFLIALSLPFWFQGHPEDEGHGIKQGLSGIATVPDDIPSKQAFLAIVKYFPNTGTNAPVQIVVDGAPTDPGVQDGIDALTTAVQDDPSLGTPAPPTVSQDGTVTLVDVPLTGPATDTQSEAAVDAVHRLRDDYVPQAFDGVQSDVLVGGDTAFITDFFSVSSSYTPVIVMIVLGLSFILLTIVFRSIVVPAKAIVMNLLSVGAAYGAIVLVFQKGGPAFGKAIADALGFQQVEAIEAWLPLFLFSILFGLSMDYHVFLLTRIREEYDKTHDNAEAVAYGLRSTGGIITGAAIIMVAVFAGFAAGRLVSLQEMGFGLAFAVLIDATIVRSILVPSAMRLLGDRNWYLPSWLQWLPKLNVEGHEETATVVVADANGSGPAPVIREDEPVR
jgi:putative drug exporter of the RND superfamily